MSFKKTFAVGVGVVGMMSSTAVASEWSSFTERVQEQNPAAWRQPGAPAEEMRPELSSEPGAGEATSFITRLEKSQNIHPERMPMREEYAAAVTLPREALSFTERVQMNQQPSLAAPAGELNREQIRMVQRTLNAKGFSTDVTGRFDEGTRSSLAGFQRENSLPVTGNLDEKTIEALGFDVSQVRPVRGPSER